VEWSEAMNDQQPVITAGKALAKELSKQQLPLMFDNKFEPKETDTGGWRIDVARWAGHPRVALWLDKSYGNNTRYFWSGFYSKSPKQVEALTKVIPKYLQIARYTGRHWKQEGRMWVWKKKPETAHPFLEMYADEPMFYFGMSDNDLNQLVRSAGRFIAGLVKAVEESKSKDTSVAFDPKNVEDGRKKIWSQIAQRQGQGPFRTKLIQAYSRRCAISGSGVPHVLEAAHITPYRA
jgi:hypothetical protein